MNRQNIETIIRDLFRDNYRAYPETYTGDSAQQTAIDAGEKYWHNRTEDEMDRDHEADVSKGDYINWCLAELSELIPEQAILNIHSDVWCQTTSRENNNPFPVVVLDVKGKTATVKYRNYPTAEPFSVQVSSLYNP
jgi:hypothetical protein